MKLSILGTRGLPAAHGGFETFAQHLAPYLVARGWDVSVYCQEDHTCPMFEDEWHGVKLIHIPVRGHGPVGTIVFDCKSVWHASRRGGLILTLGYNTAILSMLYRLKGIPNVINMDGIEWRRDKWGACQKAWLYLNDLAGCWLGNHLIADHPEIEAHLSTRVPLRKITMIPYGATEVNEADSRILEQFGLKPNNYIVVIARPEPENSLLEIVEAYCQRRRSAKLVILGRYKPDENRYHKRVMAAANDDVVFLGPIYEPELVACLRFYARLYVHGHRVGGTNPALVEALGASCPVLAHDNVYTRWVAGPRAHYFRNAQECARKLDSLTDDFVELGVMKEVSRDRFHAAFRWEAILSAYEAVLSEYADGVAQLNHLRPRQEYEVPGDSSLESLEATHVVKD